MTDSAREPLPDMEHVAVGRLVPWELNPRKKQPVDEVARSIRALGFGAPILAQRSSGRVIAGHTRLQAAKQLGLESVPVRWLDVDDHKATLLAIADNKLGEKAEWDDEKLDALVAELVSEEVELIGLDGPIDIDAPMGGESVADPEFVYKVLITCNDDAHQAELLGRFEQEGLTCQPLIS